MRRGIFDIAQTVRGAATIGISGHEKPDGDCVGSCLGLANYLRDLLPDARVDVFLERPPRELVENIPGAETIRSDFVTDVPSYDVFIILDSAKGRTKGAEAMFDAAKRKINVDHHISNPGCGEINFVDPEASSACELVYDLIRAAGGEEAADPVTREIAQALYVGMVTDTGVFRFSNTSKHTMEAAGDLLTYGFDHARIVREVFFEKTYVQQRMIARAVMGSSLHFGGRVVVSRINREDMLEEGATRDDLEGAAAQLILTRGCVCSAFLQEQEENVYRVSLRSTGEADVSRIACSFGGGGHMRAAGCTLRCTGEEAEKSILEAIERELSTSADETEK